MKSVKIGIVGLGTVGGGALNLLQANAAEISRRTGRDIVVTHVGVRREYPQYNLTGVTVAAIFSLWRMTPKLILLLKSWVAQRQRVN